MVKLSELVLEKNSNQENQAIYAVLDKCCEYFFPNESFITTNLRMLDRESKAKSKETFEAMLLPFHTRDEKWLAKYTESVYQLCRTLQKFDDPSVKKTFETVLPEIEFAIFQKYVKESPYFAQKRAQYELQLVKGCIDLATNEKISDFLTSADAKAKLRSSISYDWLIRDRISRMGDFLGLHQEVVNDGIELYEDDWRPYARRVTFNNNYNPRGILLHNDHAWLRNNQPEVFKSIRNLENEFYENWNKFRDYNDYQDNCKVYERLNKVTPSMKMSPAEAEQLRQRNIQLAEIYKAALRECDEKFPILASLRNPQQPEPTIIL